METKVYIPILLTKEKLQVKDSKIQIKKLLKLPEDKVVKNNVKKHSTLCNPTPKLIDIRPILREKYEQEQNKQLPLNSDHKTKRIPRPQLIMIPPVQKEHLQQSNSYLKQQKINTQLIDLRTSPRYMESAKTYNRPDSSVNNHQSVQQNISVPIIDLRTSPTYMGIKTPPKILSPPWPAGNKENEPSFTVENIQLGKELPTKYFHKEHVDTTTPFQDSHTQLSSKEIMTNKTARRRRREQKPNQNEEPNIITSPFSRRDTFMKQSRENQLFNIINKLLQQQRQIKKKSKRKQKLRLFDILDNVSATSDESEKDFEVIQRPKNKEQQNSTNITFPLIGHKTAKPLFESEIIEHSGTVNSEDNTKFPSVARNSFPYTVQEILPMSAYSIKNDFSKLPSVPPTNFPIKINIDKPQIQRVLDSHACSNKEDPLSWKALMHEFNHQTKETQTEKQPNNLDSMINKTVQTELKEMTEIPKSQTFFTNTSDATVEKTKEFCDQVRQEVIRKLEYQEQLEDKKTQTVSHAGVQTDKEKQDVDIESYHMEKSENIIVPPGMYSQIHAEFNDTAPEYIQVIDMDHMPDDDDSKKPERDLLNGNFSEEKKNAKEKDETKDKKKKKKEKESEMKDKKKEKDKKSSSSSSSSSSSTSSSSESSDEKKKKKKSKGKHDKHLKDKETMDNQHVNVRVQNHPLHPGKVRLHEDIDDFCYGIRELEDLQQHLESELKQSKLLFKTIETIQDGFGDDNVDNQNKNDNTPDSSIKDQPSTFSSYNFSRELLNASIHDVTEEKSKQIFETAVGNEDNEILEHYHQNVNHSQISPGLLDNTVADSTFQHQNHGFVSRDGTLVNYDMEGKEEKTRGDLLVDDEKKKGDIRRRLNLIQPTNEEIEEHAENEQRERVRAWMKEKQSQRRSEYLQELNEKRALEFRPFVSQKTYTTRQIDQNKTMQADLNREMLDENNKERLNDAERIALQVMRPSRRNSNANVHEESNSSNHSKRKYSNDRYKNSYTKTVKTKTRIPPMVRETRTSQLRKNALFRDVLRHRHAIRDRKGNRKKKNASRDDYNDKYLLDESYGSFMPQNFDDSFHLHHMGSPLSGTVHPNEFVTRSSFMKYQQKLSRDIDKSLTENDIKNIQFSGDESYFTTQNKRSTNTDDMIGTRTSNLLTDNHRADQVDNKKLKSILTSYGLEMDSDLFERKSETSQLLNEVDLALIEEETTSPIHTNETVDWNEVEKILNE